MCATRRTPESRIAREMTKGSHETFCLLGAPTWLLLFAAAALASCSASQTLSAAEQQQIEDQYNVRHRTTLMLEPGAPSENGFEFVDTAEGPTERDLPRLYDSRMYELAYGVLDCQLAQTGRLETCGNIQIDPYQEAFEPLFLHLAAKIRIPPDAVAKWRGLTEFVRVDFKVENRQGRNIIHRPCIGLFCTGPMPPPQPPQYDVRYKGTMFFPSNEEGPKFAEIEWAEGPDEKDLKGTYTDEMESLAYGGLTCRLAVSGKLMDCEISEIQPDTPAFRFLYLHLAESLQVAPKMVREWKDLTEWVSVEMKTENKKGRRSDKRPCLTSFCAGPMPPPPPPPPPPPGPE